ncbi:efflux RND transporter periplasmic adaptor subunit [Luteibacter sp. NPDC031894]|uniref:efflux RND transporter periplasmic adaptor subunit n=1 Tax=Luteibacter sp. NPDC031894 TaxID=3390572 RepID=UPI003D065233
MISFPLRYTAVAMLMALLLLGACTRQDDVAATAPQPSYAAVARGRIDVEGGLLRLAMPREGILGEVDVREGEHVRRGQPLASLDPQPAHLAIAAAQAGLDQAQAQLSLLDIRLAAATSHARRLAEADRAGAGDGPGTDEARETAAELAAQRGAARASVAASAQTLASARLALAQLTLRAPADADVLRVAAQPGANVSPQSGPLFVLLPNAPRIVRADLSEAYLDAVRPGMPALVTADASPDATPLRAHVVRVGAVVGPSSLEDDPQLRANSRSAECVLALEGSQAPRVGQRVIVRFGVDASRVPAKGR